ncbi:plancitoxin-1 [Nephila pilipes]|uniref:Plancitoxin-1 n=1 Tax=Nephila pilipes TaxID=299642 RepID=A0A8X6QP79_NEPPI|nr:plancitoxin-1 [Nephila pilipes]
MYSKLYLYVNVFVYLLSKVELSFEISCRNEKNEDVDWFIVYKLPAIDGEKRGSYLERGVAYAYITSDTSKEWILSSLSIESKKSMLGRTLKGFRDELDKGTDVAYLFYNDKAPETEKSTVGHLKGYLAFDEESGVWMIHSIPKFTKSDEHEFPSNARPNGQIAMCITFATESLNDICQHLLFCNPNIYDYDISKSIKQNLDINSQSLFSERPNFIRKAPFEKQTSLVSLDNQEFIGFAKDNQEEVDIYSDIIGPNLGEDLIVESWRRGAGGVLDPSCEDSNTVIDVMTINMTVKNRKKGIYFTYTQDHSKWAISQDDESDLVCIADLNRMESQAKRGGGAICLFSGSLRKAFKSIIDSISLCPVSYSYYD